MSKWRFRKFPLLQYNTILIVLHNVAPGLVRVMEKPGCPDIAALIDVDRRGIAPYLELLGMVGQRDGFEIVTVGTVLVYAGVTQATEHHNLGRADQGIDSV